MADRQNMENRLPQTSRITPLDVWIQPILRRRTHPVFLLYTVILILNATIYLIRPYIRELPHASSIVSPTAKFDWHKVEPSPELNYRWCYKEFQCAHLELPMDWQDPEDGNKTQLAVIKLPAKVLVTDTRYGGAIFVAYGGPGGSGVENLVGGGRMLQNALDSMYDPGFTIVKTPGASEKFYDVVSFDPRGVMHSTPRLSCFPNQYQRELWQWQSIIEHDLSSSSQVFRDKWAKWKAFGRTCSDKAKQQGNQSIAYHMNTTPVAADLLELVERHGQWREKEANRLLFQYNFHKNVTEADLATQQRTKWNRGEEKIMFWGLSYGTLVGQNFAAMYPNRIKRFVLDEVAVAADYHSGLHFRGLQSAERSYDKFFEYCHQAGPDKCALWTEGSADDIKARVTNLSEQLAHSPYSVPGSDTVGPTIITLKDYRKLVKDGVYNPMKEFPAVAKLLASLLQNDGTEFAKRKINSLNSTELKTDPSQEETLAGILCTDLPSLLAENEEDFKQYAEDLFGQSQIVGDFWAELRMRCIGWDIRPAWRLTGPFKANTSFPMLLMGNTDDPATPFENTRIVQSSFSGSMVLEQRAAGHIFAMPASSCKANATRAYFQLGELPAEGTVCEPSETPMVDGPQ